LSTDKHRLIKGKEFGKLGVIFESLNTREFHHNRSNLTVNHRHQFQSQEVQSSKFPYRNALPDGQFLIDCLFRSKIRHKTGFQI
jgi:hypothetical protein